MKKGTAFIILFLLIFCTVNATDYYVDADYGSNDTGNGSSGYPWMTITYALSQITGSGHTLHVAEGYYDESLGEAFPIYIKNGISMVGDGDSITVIDAGYSERVLNCIGITDAATIIEGFTITGGYHSSQGGGIYISAGSTLTIKNNVIFDNYLDYWGIGGGIYITNSSPRILYNTIIFNGSDSWGDGDAIAINNSSPLVKGNTIIYNISDGSSSSIYIEGSSSAPGFINNIIAMNLGAGIYCTGGGVPSIVNNTISDNDADGIYISSCYPDSIINNIISYNSGYGIYESGSASDPGKVYYNLFSANSSGLYYNEGSTAYYSAESLNNNVAECENNIDPDPLFEDRYNWDYHLHLYSSAIDAGHPSFPYSNEPLPNGGRINLGAYGNTAEATTSETPPVLPADLYVDAAAGSDDTGDGSSTDPWKTITNALSQIYTTGHTIHIAAGTYNSALGESFPIVMKNGVSLSGEDNTTTVIDAEGSSSNYLQVINCIGITDALTFIEGFTITGGYLGDYSSQGAGIFISAGSVLTIRNNTIDDNYTNDDGGGIYITNSSPVILNNTISNNRAYYGNGSAINIYSSSPQIKGNTIINNAGTGTYNCVYIYGSSSKPRLINNVIAKNTNDGIYCSSSSPVILNNTISDNTGDGIYLSSATPDSINNNIISYNSGYGIYESGTSGDPGKVWYNLFYFNASGLYYNEGSASYYTASSLNSGVAECANNIDGDPLFIDRANSDYHEQPYSPAIDAGDPLSPYDNEPESNGDRINIGAYGNTAEAAIYVEPPVLPADLYVNATTGSNTTGDGSSGTPWQTITYALSQIYTTGHTVHVAAGTYNTSLGETFPINMKNGISLAGAGDATTIIDAEDTERVLNCILITDASTFIEGFTITGGYHSSQGGGIYISAGSVLTIRNNTIDDNYSSDDGGGIYITNSSPFILNNTISNNSAYYGYGSAIDIYSSSPQIKGNTIINNAGTGTYNCIYIYGSLSKPRLIKNVIAKNTNDGIYCSSSSPVILNNTISDNTGDGIYLSSATPDSIINNIISYNSGYGIYESGTSSDPGKVWYNLYYANSTGLYYDEGSTDYYTASSLNSGVAECASNIDGDPAYIDKTNNDYHIKSGSTAIDNGDPDFPTDPDDSRIDIGAYYFIMPPPDPPVATAASNVGQTDFTANWNSAASATGYFLDVATDIDFTFFVNDFENRDVLNLTSYSITGLSANTEYYYRVRAYNEGGSGTNSNVISLSTTVDPPAPPSAPVANAGTDISQTSFVADWEPADAATSYRIDVAVEIDPVSYVSGYNNLEILNATELTVTGLTANTDYYYWIRACNSGGASVNSDTVIVTTLPDPPPAPEALDASDIIQTSFTANWNSSDNADGYYLDVSEEDTFDSFVSGYNYLDVSNVTSYSVTGLTSNTTCYYRVEAYNNGGTGGYSETITVTTLPDPPETPLFNDPTNISQISFTVNWNSSATATGYYIDVATDDGFTSFVSGYENLDVADVTSYDITGLTSETIYYYRIRAYNSGGISADSETWSLTTLPDPPPAPVALEASDTTHTSFIAYWNSATTATGYFLDVAADDAFTLFAAGFENLDVNNVLNYTVTDLDPNTTYYYRIRAYNDGGAGSSSNTISVTTLQVPAPAAPVANGAPYVGQTDFTASWNSSETATGYYLDVAADDAFTNFVSGYDSKDVFDVLSYSISGLTANTTYYYRVRAYNDGGTSDNSNTITLTTLENPPDPPGPPIVNTATDITQTSFTANWDTSTDATGYKLDVATDDAFTNFVSGYKDIDLTNITSFAIDGLSASTTYYYRMRAYNSGGTSSNSGTITLTTLPWPPPVPYPYEATTITTTSFTANWASSTTATGYNLDVAADDAFTSFVAGYENLDVSNSLSYSVNGLTLNTTYYYRVRAYNDGGESGNSNYISVTTLLDMPDIPDAPVASDAESISQTGFTAVWSSVTNAEGYYLDVAYDNTFSSYLTGYYSLDVGNTTTQDITGLQSNTDYYYRVSAYNVSGTGNNSNVIQVSTLPDPPAAPTGLSSSSCSNEVYLQWNRSTESDFMQYNVYYGTDSEPSELYGSYTGVSSNAITISDLVNGQTYYFRVTQVISPGVESDYSSTVSVKVKTGVIPRIKAKWGDVLICYNPGDSLTSFQWFVGASQITGAIKQYYVTGRQSGFYYVVTSDQDGCFNHSNLINISGSKSISVYPNPAKSNFTLNLNSDFMGETDVNLYNSTGMKALEYRTEKTDHELNCEIPVGNLKDGIYTIEVNVNDEQIGYTKLIIIE